MKAKLRVTKNGAELYAGVYDIKDSESFGKARPFVTLLVCQSRQLPVDRAGRLINP